MSDRSEKSVSKNSSNCPICDKPRKEQFAPFCSRRCADLDLGRWLKGGYVIPAALHEDDAKAGKLPEDDE
jgi:endogenous inhibitor of DNA gyrase (YacG/DUF329 family)